MWVGGRVGRCIRFCPEEGRSLVSPSVVDVENLKSKLQGRWVV